MTGRLVGFAFDLLGQAPGQQPRGPYFAETGDEIPTAVGGRPNQRNGAQDIGHIPEVFLKTLEKRVSGFRRVDQFTNCRPVRIRDGGQRGVDNSPIAPRG